jgi:hypothetical protein
VSTEKQRRVRKLTTNPSGNNFLVINYKFFSEEYYNGKNQENIGNTE